MAKEILKDEILTEEQLENVAGGTRGELSCDTKFLHALGLMHNFYEPGFCEKHMEDVQEEVNEALAKLPEVGTMGKFSVKANLNGANSYRVGTWANPNCPRDVMYRAIAKAAGQPNFDYSKFL